MKQPTAIFAAVLATIANECSLRLGVRQQLEPRSSIECLATALSASPDVLEIVDRDEERFAVLLRDSTLAGGRRAAAIWASPADSANEVTVHFFWDPLRHPRAAEERAATMLARRVLAHLRATCAPNSPSRVDCVYNTGRRAASCDSG
jgi:hypothetical protein